MIDYIALTLGHGLLIYGFFRLFMNDELDFDPLVDGLKQTARKRKRERIDAARASRRAGADPDDAA
ncbi:MAG: hypothetical protein SXU28_02575 [Pseudomonadota bacterium]|nr:hypothetical protein [Pseudomonadota bacterium]